MKKQSRHYGSLQAWMEGTRTNARQLVARVKAETGHSISEPLISLMLRGSRRCSRINAVTLHVVTGLPLDVLMDQSSLLPNSGNSSAVDQHPERRS